MGWSYRAFRVDDQPPACAATFAAAAATASASPRYSAEVNLQSRTELVLTRRSRRDVELGDVVDRHCLEMHHQRAQRVAVRRDQHVLPSEQLWRDDVMPIRQHARDDILQAFRGRQHVGCEQSIARIIDRMLRAVGVDGWRRYVVTATPQLGLLGSVPLGGLFLVEPLQRTVVTFVEPPMPLHR